MLRVAIRIQPSAFAGASDGALTATLRAYQKSCASVPTAIATTKTMTGVDKVDKFASAGPGHNPTKPQPIPKKSSL